MPVYGSIVAVADMAGLLSIAVSFLVFAVTFVLLSVGFDNISKSIKRAK